jgi:hypothetical protein
MQITILHVGSCKQTRGDMIKCHYCTVMITIDMMNHYYLFPVYVDYRLYSGLQLVVYNLPARRPIIFPYVVLLDIFNLGENEIISLLYTYCFLIRFQEWARALTLRVRACTIWNWMNESPCGLWDLGLQQKHELLALEAICSRCNARLLGFRKIRLSFFSVLFLPSNFKLCTCRGVLERSNQ